MQPVQTHNQLKSCIALSTVLTPYLAVHFNQWFLDLETSQNDSLA